MARINCRALNKPPYDFLYIIRRAKILFIDAACYKEAQDRLGIGKTPVSLIFFLLVISFELKLFDLLQYALHLFQVTAMQNELTALRPQLLETSDETERLMIKIEQDTIQVEAKKEIVACDEALANEAAAAAQAIRDDCENDLAEAIPALQSAVTALDTLNANDITVVKTMKNPAPIVKFVVESVCVMKGVNPDRKPGNFQILNEISCFVCL